MCFLESEEDDKSSVGFKGLGAVDTQISGARP